MAEHKAPTQVTIAATEEETALSHFVHTYWPHALAAAVATSLIVLFVQWRREQASSDVMEGWTSLGQDVRFGGGLGGGIRPPSAAVLADLSAQLDGHPAGAWAKALEVGQRLREDDREGAARTMNELQERYPDHPLIQQRLYPPAEPGGRTRDLVAFASAQWAALDEWKEEHADIFRNPALPEGSPRVRFTTSAGTFVIGLYADRAPLHVENFLKLCREGFYDGLKFHRVVKGAMVQGGCPNTRDEESDENVWGTGSNGGTIEMEDSGLWHFRGAVSAAATGGGGPTSDCQFFIVTGDDQHQWDRQYTVFGTLLEGEATVTTIEDGKVLDEKALEPVVIEKTEIL